MPRIYVDKDPEGRFMARIGLRCSDCDTWMEFLGVAAGNDPNGVRVSPDKKELRIAIGTKETLAEYYTQALEALIVKPKVITPNFQPYERKRPSQPRRAHA